MKTIKSLKDITTLEVDDVVMFGDLRYVVDKNYHNNSIQYYLYRSTGYNDIIFEKLNLKKRDFTEKLGIDANCNCDFPETKSLEALTALVSALFKECEKQKELPKTWEEFCERNPLKEEETFINSASKPITIGDYVERRYRIPDKDKNLCISEQEAEAHIALMQLRQLRKCYVGNWEPDWMNDKTKFVLQRTYDTFYIYETSCVGFTLSFPTHELANQFLTNFKDLLEIAKPLL